MRNGNGNGNVVTTRDKAALEFIARFGFVTMRQTADAVYGGSAAVAYRRLRVLQRSGLITRRSTFQGHPSIYLATGLGARTAGCGLNPARVGYAVLATLGHSLAIVDLAQEWVRRVPGATYTTEREIRADWHRQTDPDRQSYGRIPDLVVHMPSGRTCAVEYDFTAKRSSEYRRLVLSYVANARYDRVYWFCRTQATAERLRAVINELGLAKRVSAAVWGTGDAS